MVKDQSSKDINENIQNWIVEVMNRGVLLPSDAHYQYALYHFVTVKDGKFEWGEQTDEWKLLNTKTKENASDTALP